MESQVAKYMYGSSRFGMREGGRFRKYRGREYLLVCGLNFALRALDVNLILGREIPGRYPLSGCDQLRGDISKWPNQIDLQHRKGLLDKR